MQLTSGTLSKAHPVNGSCEALLRCPPWYPVKSFCCAANIEFLDNVWILDRVEEIVPPWFMSINIDLVGVLLCLPFFKMGIRRKPCYQL